MSNFKELMEQYMFQAEALGATTDSDWDMYYKPMSEVTEEDVQKVRNMFESRLALQGATA